MKNIFLLTLLGFCLFSCGGAADSTTTASTQTATSTPAPAQQKTTGKTISLPPVTSEFAMNLFENCDYIDIIMYKEGFSMNISQKGSIQTVIQGISAANPVLESNCPAAGRLFFQNKGATIGEADLHFTSGVCAALVFYEKGKRKYASQMTEKGASIFANYFQNANKLKSQQGQ